MPINRNLLLAILLTSLMLAPGLALISTTAQLDDFPQLAVPNGEETENTLDSGPSPPLFVDGLPPLMCPDGEVCPTPVRRPVVPADTTSHEDPEWWFAYGPDLDWNGFDDRLQYILADVYPSQSPTAEIGADGELTVALIVDWAWHPEQREMDQLEVILRSHGWVGPEGGAFFRTVGELDSIIVDKVPQSALMDIYFHPGVVVVEMQDVMVPSLEYATPAIKARSSSTYASSAHMMGYRGDEVVIAILDSGVDNEHRSLNDFDDIDDAPNGDANSYDDQKWIAGYDSTDSFNQGEDDGSIDPDDTAGHGTHVAGIALGTGGPSRQHVGVAPGAYLVDVKVFTDVGRSNSQYTIAGINWTINNRDTNWGNNASSNGIDIISMSFGRARSPTGQDFGDNGSVAEARIVNDAFDAGIVPVCAMGNDAAQYVAAPASADHCIAVAASNDLDSVDRSDDEVASYSNWGPRIPDGDSNDWDEHKPDVIAPGSGIKSAQHEPGGIFGGGALAGDSYIAQSGTSMSTPMVAGLCALIIQANPAFRGNPARVKASLQNNSEFLVIEDDTVGALAWNRSEGFGRVDATTAILASGGDWVNFTSPAPGLWMSVEGTYRLRGSAFMPVEDKVNSTNQLTGIFVSARYTYDVLTNIGGGTWVWVLNNKSAFGWVEADGIANWTYDLTPELWKDGATLYVEVRAKDDRDRWSDRAWAEYHLGETWMTVIEPSGYAALSGDVTFRGDYKAVLGDRIEFKVGSNGDWRPAFTSFEYPYTCTNPERDECEVNEWLGSWDSTEVIDGGWLLYFRLVTESGWTSTPVERYVNIDNVPAAPELSSYGEIAVEENGIEVDSATVDSFLNVRAQLRNNGDMHARNVLVVLYENGDQIASETLSRVESTDVVEVVFGYHPTTTGVSSLKVEIDPSDTVGESDESNNEQEITFTVDSIPVGVDLALREGAATTNPRVANPNGDITLSLRLENLGSSDASGAVFTLEQWSELGWDLLDERTINIISGAGYFDVPFTIHEGQLEVGVVRFRASVSIVGVSDLDPTNDQLEFTLFGDEAQLQGARKLELSEGHVPLGFFGYSGENLLFTGDGDSLWVHRINERYDLVTCLELESDWAGEFSISSGEGDSANVVWTRRLIDQFGATVTTLSFSTVDLSCTNTEVIDLMPELMLAEGTYWGIDLEVDDGKALIGGYHRDLFTSGTYDDVTSVFTLDSNTPLDSESWRRTREVIPVIEPPIGMAGSVQIARGDDWTHMTYQAMRDDGTGSERVGTFYAHGRLGEANWSFKTALGDHTLLGQLSVLQDSDGEDVVLTGWKEGVGYESELVLIRTDSSLQDKEVKRVPAAGISTLVFVETARGVQVFYESVGPLGRQIQYSMMDADSIDIGTPLTEGTLVMVGRSETNGESHIIYSSPTMDWRARMLIDDRDPTASDRGILDTIRLWTGLDARTFELAWKIGVSICAMGLILLLASGGVLSRRRRRSEALPVVVEKEEDEDEADEDETGVEVIDVEEESIREFVEPDEPAKTAELDEPEKPSPEVESTSDSSTEKDIEDGRARRKSRRQRRSAREAEVGLEDLPEPPSPGELGELPEPPSPGEIGELPEPPAPGELGMLPPPPGRDVICECGATFRIKTVAMKRVKCPVCDAKISL
jgi:hypothetical protein